MNKTMKIIISLMLTIAFLALMGCRNDVNTTSPEPTLSLSMTQDVNASKEPTKTNEPRATVMPLQPDQPYLARLGSSYAQGEFTAEDRLALVPKLDLDNLNAIRNFLEIKDEYGVRNGDKMNEWYSPDDPTTWFYTPTCDHDVQEQYGYTGYQDLLAWKDLKIQEIHIVQFVQKTESPIEGFVGDLDLNGCNDLRIICVTGKHAMGEIRVCNCEKLKELFSDGDNLTSICIENSNVAQVVVFKNDRIETIKTENATVKGWSLKGAMNLKNALISSYFLQTYEIKMLDWSSTRGQAETGKYYFNLKMDCDGSGTVKVESMDDIGYQVYAVAVPDEGHSFIGWYDAEGNLVSTNEKISIVGKLADYEYIGGPIPMELGSETQLHYEARFK